MTDSDLHNAIRTRFGTEIETGKGLWTIYDNQPKAKPTDGSIWCRVTIRRSESEQIESGPAGFRRHGRVYCQLFGPVGKGDRDLLAMADAIRAAFEGHSAGGVRYGVATTVPVGERDAEYQVNVEIPFAAD